MNYLSQLFFIMLLSHQLHAEVLSLPAELGVELNSLSQTIQVAEPHLYSAGRQVLRQYRGWPASAVLDHLLGTEWRALGVDVEFRALDGYVAHIPSERFSQHQAFLVFEDVNHDRFVINNIQQNEQDVPLGPYYLVWNNMNNPELIAEGSTYWPYQIKEISVSRLRKSALQPPGLPAEQFATAGLVQQYCLSCHQVNGFGGEKWPGNLALLARKYERPAFIRWTLEPDTVKPGTRMPGLPSSLPEVERKILAEHLYDYLIQVPVLTD